MAARKSKTKSKSTPPARRLTKKQVIAVRKAVATAITGLGWVEWLNAEIRRGDPTLYRAPLEGIADFQLPLDAIEEEETIKLIELFRNATGSPAAFYDTVSLSWLELANALIARYAEQARAVLESLAKGDQASAPENSWTINVTPNHFERFHETLGRSERFGANPVIPDGPVEEFLILQHQVLKEGQRVLGEFAPLRDIEVSGELANLRRATQNCSPAVQRAVELLYQGESYDAVAERTGLKVGHIRKIASDFGLTETTRRNS